LSGEHGCESPHLSGISLVFRRFGAINITDVIPT